MDNINKINNLINSLIFDRTQDDADYALDCVRNAVYHEHDLKGAYNISDRNRVGGAINFISDCLVNNAGLYEARVKIKDNWDYPDIIKREHHEEILYALNFLKYFLPYSKTSEVPENLNKITYQKANALEFILFDLCGVLARLFDSWLYCGDGYMSDFDQWNWQGWDN